MHPDLRRLAGTTRLSPPAAADIMRSQVFSRWRQLMPVARAEHDFAATRDAVDEAIGSAPGPGQSFFIGDPAGRLAVSDLNRATAQLRKPAALIFDEPLRPRPGFLYDFAGVAVEATAAGLPFLVECGELSACRLTNLDADLTLPGRVPSGSAPPGFIRLRACDGVSVDSCSLRGGFLGIVLRDGNRRVCVRRNVIRDCVRSGIYAQGDNETILIESNTVDGNATSSNGANGIVLNSVVIRDGDRMAADFWPDYHWPIPTPIRERLTSPRRVIVRGNTVRNTVSGGIYLDGAFECIVSGNTVDNADKEGICLDNGCFLVLVDGNTFTRCGMRARQSDEDLHFDFITHWGRGEDGSARAKLPGVSLDNAMACVISNNRVTHNAGGGIKLVRTGFLNDIVGNTVEANSPGTDPAWRFFGILVDECRPDCETDEHDFLPSHGNAVRDCAVRDNHAGVVVSERSRDNIVTGNRFADEPIDIFAPWAPGTVCRDNACAGRVRLYFPIVSEVRHALWRIQSVFRPRPR